MDNASPIKSFLRKHSPMKSRNKPLPVAPQSRDESPTRQPLRSADLNARPTSSSGQEKAKRRLASLFKSSDKSSELPKSTITSQHSHSRSVPGAPRQRATVDEQRLWEGTASPPSLRRLNAKVLSLEEQLREAQRQLDAYAKHPQAAEIRTRNRSHGSRDRSSSALGSYAEVDKKRRLVRERSSDRFQGVVESLLQGTQSTPDHAVNYSRPASQRPSASSSHRRASADVAAAYEEFLRRQTKESKHWHHHSRHGEEADGVTGDYPDDGDDDRREGEDTPARQKRKRSELRETSWRAVQDYQARELLSRQWERQGSEPVERSRTEARRSVSDTTERPSQKAKYDHDKALPASPPKAASASPTRHQRTSSLTKNELPAEQRKSQTPRKGDGSGGAPSPARRYATSPTKLMPVAEEFEWDEEVF